MYNYNNLKEADEKKPLNMYAMCFNFYLHTCVQKMLAPLRL